MARKGISQKDKILQIVEQIQEGELIIYKCAVDVDCVPKCSYAQKKTFLASNFKRHLQTSHPDAYKGLNLDDKPEEEPAPKKPKGAKLLVDLEKRDCYLGLLQLVTINNLPFSFIEWIGSKTLIHPVLNAIGNKWTRHRVAAFVKAAAATIREILRSRMQKRMLSLKIDSASRRGRAIFGINAQYADEDGQVRIRHLGKFEIYFCV